MRQSRGLKIGLVIVAFIAITIGIAVSRSEKGKEPTLQVADDISLSLLWQQYKNRYWHKASGRTVDPDRDNITTSEGQSYTMLRAVWINDRSTFDKTWGWTVQNLQRPDKLFSWRWSPKSEGSEGATAEDGGQNSASDGDSDIAFALVMASERWQQPGYRNAAQDIIRSMWEHEVIIIDGKPYLAANNIEKTSGSETVLVNPSYLAPYAYRTFASIDGEHDWEGLTDASYELLAEVMEHPLNTKRSAQLPPNWVTVNRQTGALSESRESHLDTDFGFDAFRTVWRVALDWHWHQAPEAHTILEKFEFLKNRWEQDDKLIAIYSHDGQPRADYPKQAFYGGTLGYFQFIQPGLAKAIYENLFVSNYDSTKGWETPLGYYDESWAWFGVGLYQHQLLNLADGQTR